MKAGNIERRTSNTEHRRSDRAGRSALGVRCSTFDVFKVHGDVGRGRDGRAFTLIELMVALALFGLVIIAIYSSWMSIMRGSEVGMKAAAAAQRSRIAMRAIEDALLCVRSYGGDIQYYSFDAQNGEDDASLSFVAKLPGSFLQSGRFGDFDVRRVTFSVEQGSDSRELVMRQAPLLMDMDKDEEQHPVVLAKDVKEFKMAFWDVRSGDWRDEWTETNQLPPLVRITLKYGGAKFSSTPVEHDVTRIVSLPAMTVPPAWQSPIPIRQPLRPITPGQLVHP